MMPTFRMPDRALHEHELKVLQFGAYGGRLGPEDVIVGPSPV